MAKVILKYPIPLSDSYELIIPRYSSILTAQIQNGVIVIWALVDEDYRSDLVIYPIRIVGTGNPIEDGCLDGLSYISTVQNNGFVWHIFCG